MTLAEPTTNSITSATAAPEAGSLSQTAEQAAVITNGAAAAALLASGIGSTALGLFVILNEANTTFHDWMLLDEAVGTLSGKSVYATAVWLLSWFVMHLLWRKREVDFKKTMYATGVLIVIGLLGTFPPFYMLFAQH